MERIIGTLKRKDISTAARKEYKDLCEAQIIVIDDIMNVTVDREEGNMLFAFINSVYETTSFIITVVPIPIKISREAAIAIQRRRMLTMRADRWGTSEGSQSGRLSMMRSVSASGSSITGCWPFNRSNMSSILFIS